MENTVQVSYICTMKKMEDKHTLKQYEELGNVHVKKESCLGSVTVEVSNL